MIGYAKYFGSNKRMFFKISDKKLLKNYTEIWKKISNLINTNFDSEPIYGDNDGDNDKYVKTKIKSYGVKKKKQIFRVIKQKMHHANIYH